MSGIEWARAPGGLALDGGRILQALADWMPAADARVLREMAGRAPLELGVGAPLLPEMHNPDHDEPFALFVQAMADELLANAGKGDRAGWLTCPPDEMMAEIWWHSAKLALAVKELHQAQALRYQSDDEVQMRVDAARAAVREHTADVANCAMMLADIEGVL